MGSLGELLVKIKADSSGFNTGMQSASKTLKVFGIAAAAAAGTAAVVFTKKSVDAAMDMETQMANISTLLDGDVTPRIAELRKGVQDLSIATGKTTEDLTSGMYQVISAFGDTAESMDILDVAAKASTAGLSTTEEAINMLSAVTKGYGDTSVEAATQVSDLAFTTVKLGQTTFPELAAAIGKVVPMSEALSISQEELFGVMATLTGVTGSTSEVATQYRGVLTSLAKPNTELIKIYDKLGVATGKELVETYGLQQGMIKLKKAADEEGVELIDLVSSVEGVTAMMALTGAQQDVWIDKQGKMMDVTDATSDAFEKQQNTVEANKKKIAAFVKVMQQEFGAKLLPVIAQFTDYIILHMPEIEKFMKSAFDVAAKAGGVLRDVIKAIWDKGKKLYDHVSQTLGPAIERLGEAFGGSDGKVDLFGGALDLLIGILTLVADAITCVINLVADLNDAIDALLKKWDPFFAKFEGIQYLGSANNTGLAFAGGGMGMETLTDPTTPISVVRHDFSGSIKVTGVNNEGEFVGSAEMVADEIRKDLNRYSNVTSVSRLFK